MRKADYIPQPTRHTKGQAVVRLNGQDIYLGEHGSAAAKAKYEGVIAEWLANGRRLPQAKRTINEIVLAYVQHAQEYYAESPQEIKKIRLSLRTLKELFGRTPAHEFGPLKLKAVRQRLLGKQTRVHRRTVIEEGKSVVHERTTDYHLARRTINMRTEIIKRMFKWAVENEMVPADLHHALSAVVGLKSGRCTAKDRPPVRPVCDEVVETTLPHVSRHVGGLIQLQRLTGARSGELVIMRACDIDMSNPKLWVYRPIKHKNAYRGQKREIYIGPKAQEIVKQFLTTKLEAYLFSPKVALQERHAMLRKARKTKVQPSQFCRKKSNPKRTPGEHFTVYSYRHAIASACKKAGIPQWHPHQLRHSAGTFIRRHHGVELARIILGHTTAFTTEIYAEVDQRQAMEVMSKIG